MAEDGAALSGCIHIKRNRNQIIRSSNREGVCIHSSGIVNFPEQNGSQVIGSKATKQKEEMKLTRISGGKLKAQNEHKIGLASKSNFSFGIRVSNCSLRVSRKLLLKVRMQR